MLLRIRFSSPSFSSLWSFSQPDFDQSPICKIRFFVFSSSNSSVFSSLYHNHRRTGCRSLRSRYALHLFSASAGNVSPGPDVHGDEDSDQYLQASLLIPETIRHYNLWKEGFVEQTKWSTAAQRSLFSSFRTGVESNVHSIGHGFLQKFRSPTVFLKITCDGNLLLPVIVGEFAIIRLIDAISGEENEECPDQFKFVNNIVKTFGYQVKMVRITDRVVNTYYARLYLRKTADNTNISIDARPSDALNVAERFKAPIYVSKDIVVKDAIKVVYGNWSARSTRIVYDVSLDSAPDEPDPLFVELDLVQKMNEAVLEERFEDAAFWRDTLRKLRTPRHEL